MIMDKLFYSQIDIDNPGNFDFGWGERISVRLGTFINNHDGVQGVAYSDISRLLIIPGKNIVADLYMDSQPKVDWEWVFDQGDFPTANPLFSQDFETVAKGHYRFRTKLARSAFTLPGVKEYLSTLPRDVVGAHVREFELPEAARDDFMSYENLGDLLRRVGEIAHVLCNGKVTHNEDLKYDTILRQITMTEEYEGDCKAVAVATAGFLNALGIPARRIHGGVMGLGGHAWTEVLIPEYDAWVPVDVAGANHVGNYPENIYYFMDVDLPLVAPGAFRDAQLVVRYE